MIFVVDNYDSFTFNLVQALGRLDPDVRVARNDRFEPRDVIARRPRAVVVSPGPGRPERAGRTIAMIAEADAGILYRPPENVVREFPQFPVARSYDELRAAFEHAAEELA